MSAIKLLAEARECVDATLSRTIENGSYCSADSLALDDLLARIDALLKTGGWFSIESAPKDGTEILGWREDCGIILIRWDTPENFCTEKECEEMGAESAENPDWFCADFVAGSRLEGNETPTHWMPLPLPPLPEAK